jgi:hypothetical protein
MFPDGYFPPQEYTPHYFYRADATPPPDPIPAPPGWNRPRGISVGSMLMTMPSINRILGGDCTLRIG